MSKSETYYKQCVMHRPTEKGKMVHTAWIPEKFASQGRQIRLGKKGSTEYTHVWTVEQVSQGRQPESYVAAHERDYATQRNASDI